MNKNKLFLSLTLMLSCLTQSALAQNDKGQPQTVERYSVGASDTSDANRVGKRFYLSAQPIGFAVAPVPAIGLNAGYYLNPDLILQVEYSSGKLPRLFYDLEARTLAFNAKYFFGGSFYMKGGAAYRQLAIKNVTCLFCSQPNRVLLEDAGAADSIAAELAIGNQWQWDNFTLGCDWIGLMVPVATIGVRNSFSTKSTISKSDREELDKSWESLAKVQSFELLRLYLGASF